VLCRTGTGETYPVAVHLPYLPQREERRPASGGYLPRRRSQRVPDRRKKELVAHGFVSGGQKTIVSSIRCHPSGRKVRRILGEKKRRPSPAEAPNALLTFTCRRTNFYGAGQKETGQATTGIEEEEGTFNCRKSDFSKKQAVKVVNQAKESRAKKESFKGSKEDLTHPVGGGVPISRGKRGSSPRGGTSARP